MSGPYPKAVIDLMRAQLCFHPPVPTSDFSGQTVIVTGGNAGLGREAAKFLARLGVERLIIACRTVSKGEEAREYIQKASGSTKLIEVWQLDLSSFDSVKAFAQRAQQLDRLDALLLNAGMWPKKFTLLEGYEYGTPLL
jgi:retinol dehydrogenase 12